MDAPSNGLSADSLVRRVAIAAFILLSFLSSAHPQPLAAVPLILESGEEKISLLELYTSEGCSSCPPAESWLSNLKQSTALWKRFVPVSFHVDYWNSLGWPDQYSKPAFTARQRSYAALWQSQSIYTPEFILNGVEWSPGEIPSEASGVKVGNLHVEIKLDKKMRIIFLPKEKRIDAIGKNESLVAEVAMLGTDIQITVPRGENAGHTLSHDFAALTLHSVKLAPSSSGAYTGEINLPLVTGTPVSAMAAWVHPNNIMTPIQAVGGWLK